MTAATALAPKRIHPARAIIVASIGNALEWFDLIIFGFLSVVIAKEFFPSSNPATALLMTLATFGVAFLVRPLGGIVLGIYADKAGRMKALTMAATIMMVGTGMIAFMPTYDSIGVWATIGLVIARLLQGFSAGGEFASATAFLAEQSVKRRGFFASWQIASQGLTTILASAAGAALFAFFSPEDLQNWAWRLPFFFGMLIGPVALYIRLKVPETPEFQEAETAEAPLAETFKLHKFRLLVSIGVSVLGTVATFVILYIPTFASRELGIAPRDAFIATLATGFVQFVMSPFVGMLGDKIGRRPIMMVAAATMFVAIYPLYAFLVAHPTAQTLLMVQIIYGLLLTGYFASQPAFMSDLFPVRTRGTGMSLGYNFAVTLFGGFAPLIIASLVTFTGSKLAASFYVMLAAAISLSALFGSRRLRL